MQPGEGPSQGENDKILDEINQRVCRRGQEEGPVQYAARDIIILALSLPPSLVFHIYLMPTSLTCDEHKCIPD